MGLFSFIKTVGTSIFSKKNDTTTPEAEKHQLKSSELMEYVKKLGLKYEILTITLRGDDVVLEGKVANQADSERITLAVGNVEGVDTVDNKMTVSVPTPASKMHTVVSGDTLSKISKTYYGDAMKYNTIFEANKPMLTDVNKIYPGQVLRIPEL
ncbi:peptidoglycan-binding protein LysM [Flavobacterium antarcticum]|uniref:peptidoglycan-binding protein LysM n=1 Tax=Flavobacterium antarcticum TaxID=271155 RepID=UPI0003B6B058|nr:peptidoglycan-binding protein LysM [Flavobacterium antarcticum]